MDISDDSELEVVQVTPRRSRLSRRPAPTVDLVRPKVQSRPKISQRQAKRRKATPPVIELDDDDRIIETCSSYEEAFFGNSLTVNQLVVNFPAAAPPPEVPEAQPNSEPVAAVVSEPVSAVVATTGRRPAPNLSLLALSLKAFRQSRPKPVQTLRCVTLPKELPVPAAPAPQHARNLETENQQKQPEEDEVVRFDEETQETLPQVPYSQAYVERLRNSSAADGKCCVCRASFIPGELVLGYIPAADPSAPSTSQPEDEQAKWLHSRCLPDEELQMAPGEWVAFSPHVSDEERQRLMTILSIRRSASRAARRPKLWAYAPALRQGWQRWAVPPTGAARPVPPSARYTAPLLSLVSQQARAVLLRARQRRVVQPATVPLGRPTGTGPSVVARRAQVTATSRRPASASTAEDPPQSRRQWRRQNALGDRAQEFFAAAPVMILAKDWSSEEPCIICHENLLKGDEVRRLPCLHSFHRSCIDRWLRLKAVCPLDKLSVKELLAQPRSEVASSAEDQAATR